MMRASPRAANEPRTSGREWNLAWKRSPRTRRYRRRADARARLGHEPGRERVMASCSHLDQVQLTELPASVEGCEECLKTCDPWLHLRICLECGRVGCCDRSPNRHASRHAREAGHPLIRSLEPGEDWSFCFVDDIGLVIPQVRGQTRIPPSPLG